MSSDEVDRLSDLEQKVRSLEGALAALQGAQQQIWLSIPPEQQDQQELTQLGVRLMAQAQVLTQSFEMVQRALNEEKASMRPVMNDMSAELAALRSSMRLLESAAANRSFQDDDLKAMNQTVLSSTNSTVDALRDCLIPLVTYLSSIAELQHRDFMKSLLSTTVALHEDARRLTQNMELSLFRGRNFKLPPSVVYDLSPAGNGTAEPVSSSGKSRGSQSQSRPQTVVVHPYLTPCLCERAAFLHIEKGEWAQLVLLLEQSPNLVVSARYFGPGRNFSLLHCAVYMGNVDIAIMLLNLGAPVNVKSADRVTALHLANEKGDERILSVLLGHGGQYYEHMKSVKTEPNHYLSTECVEWRNKYAAAARKFLKKNETDMYVLNVVTVLTVSALGQTKPMGMPKALPKPICSAALSVHPDALVAAELAAEYAICGHRQPLALILRSYPGFVNGLRASILGYTLLMLACDNGHDMLVRMLIDVMHADVNAYSQPQPCAKRKEMVSALYVAAKRNHVKVVKVLLRRGADWTQPVALRGFWSSLFCCGPSVVKDDLFKDDPAISDSVREEISRKSLLYQTPAASMRAYVALSVSPDSAPSTTIGSAAEVLTLSDEEEDNEEKS
jgi:ankyrin repeat protein